jgi:hypothetical protein
MGNIFKFHDTREQVIAKIPGDYLKGEESVWSVCEVDNEKYVYFIATDKKLEDYMRSLFKSEYIDNAEWKEVKKKFSGRLETRGNGKLFP